MTARLGRPLTYLRLVFLLLGAGLAVGVALLDATLIVVIAEYVDGVALVVASVVVVLAPFAVTLFIPPLRQVEAVAAESLLGAKFADGAPGPATRGADRLRSTAWFLLHLISGGGVVALLVYAVPLGVSWLTAGAWRPPAGLLVIAGALLATVLTGPAMARLAPALLGPSYSQRLERLEAETARLAERNRLARELHDSVGHALSVVTLQSAGARRRLHADDRASAEAALEAIETTARDATAELDHMLGLLRDRDAGTVAPPRPELTLGDLDSLLAATRRAGLEVVAVVEGDLGDVPKVVGREAYRIVQEGLTNALRHASRPRAELTLVRRPGLLRIDLTNPAGAGGPRRGGGRGLAGISERAHALGGSATHRSEAGRWELVVELPLARTGGAAGSSGP